MQTTATGDRRIHAAVAELDVLAIAHAGSGFACCRSCFYADISLAICALAREKPSIKRFMIVDLVRSRQC